MTSRVIASTVWMIAVASTIAGWIVMAVAEPDSYLRGGLEPGDFTFSFFMMTLVTFGALVVLRGDRPRYGWLMLASGGLFAFTGMSGIYALHAWETGAPLFEVAVWVGDLIGLNFLLSVLLLPALFPDGYVASPRWRLPVKATVFAWVLFQAFLSFADRPTENWMLNVPEEIRPSNPLGVIPLSESALTLLWLLLLVATIVITIGSLVTRWRRAPHADSRQQVKWVIFAFAILTGLLALQEVLNPLLTGLFGLDLRGVLNLLIAVVTVGLAFAWGLAVLRFKLHAVDLVINRTIVYAILTVLITAVYVLFVVLVGAMLPLEQTGLALIATGVVAVGFAPVRGWVQSGVNRMMFGQRDDPYAVMSELGRLMSEAGTPEETLQTLVETVAESLKLPGAAIELEKDGNWERQASHGGEPEESSSVVVPLRDRGELVGRLVVAQRSPHESLSEGDLSLLNSISGSAAAVARSVRLTSALQASRERLVLAREEERRRIRRDLHDGLGPSLAAQTFQLDEILERVHSDPDRTVELVSSLKANNQQLIADVRRLVYELRPPTLDELGLAGALDAHIAQLEGSSELMVDVSTYPDPLPPVPAAVEVAAYHIVREAINNVTRHADATRCVAKLTAGGSELVVSVKDDGRGITGDDQPGVGVLSMRERTEELGGTFTLQQSSGTEVVATLPLRNGDGSD
ncbi:MAG TPA: GAF domain-containing sensor histidine kinase [Acidimicrobiia bacterium]